MGVFLSAVLTIGAVLLAIPVAIFFVEIIAALTLRLETVAGTALAKRTLGQRVAVSVPAHNEGDALRPTLADIKVQLCDGDRLIVIADNCSDDTAAVAAACGAEVIERQDRSRRGKGYALDFGLRHIALVPPDIVIVIDADCRVAANTIDVLATACVTAQRPAQALDLMIAPPDSEVNQRVAEFAWRVKNWLRPLGLKALGLPCQLMGTGMAFPWDVIGRAELASGLVVEDLKLGLDLTALGHAAVFCPTARVTSHFPSTAKATGTQRQRWEGGHVGVIATTLPRLLGRALAQRNWDLLALTLDLAVPPLSLLAVLVTAMLALSALFALLGFASPALAVSVATFVAFVVAAILAWLRCGRDVLPAAALISIVPYVLGKFRLYRAILGGKSGAPGSGRIERIPNSSRRTLGRGVAVFSDRLAQPGAKLVLAQQPIGSILRRREPFLKDQHRQRHWPRPADQFQRSAAHRHVAEIWICNPPHCRPRRSRRPCNWYCRSDRGWSTTATPSPPEYFPYCGSKPGVSYL